MLGEVGGHLFHDYYHVDVVGGAWPYSRPGHGDVTSCATDDDVVF